MLQQTRPRTVLAYFERWMARFPTIRVLAAAREHSVLRIWEGLGYYARARNMHRTARIVVGQLGGTLPSSVHELRNLPGIGQYTAAAIASIAFGADEPAIDANLRRILTRVFNVGIPANSGGGQKRIEALARRHLPAGQGGNFNQALMDLGSAVCLPRQPRCDICPVKSLCAARRLGLQDRLPTIRKRPSIPHHTSLAAVIRKDDRVLLAKRPSAGLLGGLWEFPNVRYRQRTRPSRDDKALLAAAFGEAYGLRIRNGSRLVIVRHAYSHFRTTVHAYECETDSEIRDRSLRWLRIGRLPALPMGKVDRQIAKRIAA
jgi:A/G-specific adenine glycosylase